MCQSILASHQMICGQNDIRSPSNASRARIKYFVRKILSLCRVSYNHRGYSNVNERRRPNPTNRLIQLASQNKWEKFIERCETHPQDARYQEMKPGNFVLHQVLRMGGGFAHLPCTGQAPVEAIRALINAFPDALYDINKMGRSVFFVSNYNSWDMDVLELLIQRSVHVAIDELVECPGFDVLPQEIIKDHIIPYLPNMVMQSDIVGHTILHSMIIHHTEFNRIQLVLKYCPELASRISFTGRTPLHLACYHNSNVTVLQDLVRIYPQALQMKDHSQRTPMQALLLNDS